MRFAAPIPVALLAAALLACGRSDLPAPTVSAPAPEIAADPVAVDVETVPVTLGAIHSRVSVPGSIVARRVSRIGAEVRGRIEAVYVDEGDRVDVGDPLFQIDREPFEVALRQAEAGLALARAERRQIEVDLRRADELHKKAIVSVDERDRMRTHLAVAQARETQAAESVALAAHNLDQTRVTAPFAGSIAARLADEGTTALVQPQTIVVELQETAVLEAEGNIPESQLAIVRVGDPAQVHVEGRADPIETTVASVGDTIDPATRTYHVRMQVPNEDQSLKAGVFARIDILPQDRREVLLVPRDSVRTEAGRTRVLVVRDGRAEAVPVRLGIASDTQVEVISGVELGSEVVVGPSAREIAPGMRVRVISKTAGAAP